MSDQSTFVLPPPPAPAAPTGHRTRLVAVLAGALALVLVVTGVVMFRGGGRAEAVALALEFTVGESETYAISQTIDAEISTDGFGGEVPALDGLPLVMEMSETVTWDTVSVDPDGVATISVSTSEQSASVNGIEMPASDVVGPPVEMRVAPDGRILSIGDLSFAGLEAGGLPGQGGMPGMDQLTPLLPEDGAPVAPGDTWDTSYSQDFPFGEGSIDYEVRSTYLRNQEVGGVEVAVIRSTMTVPLDLGFRMKDVAELLEDQEGGPSASDLAEIGNGRIAFGGELSFEMTSFVDFAARELMRSESAGEFDVTVELAGFPEFEGSMALAGSFTQEMQVR